jgi:hypothetical protein
MNKHLIPNAAIVILNAVKDPCICLCLIFSPDTTLKGIFRHPL